MFKPIRALALSTALLAQPALAQPVLAQPAPSQPAPSQPAPGQPAGLSETLLHIAETAEVTRAPDEVVATLRAEARAGTAAAAQEAVNRSIAVAVERARAVEGVQVSTGGYWTARVDDARAWQASQSVTLRGQAAPALLELAGTLQGQGLAMVSLEWRLRRETARLAREEASGLALDALRRRAAAIAGQLELELVGLREVRIDVPEGGGPRPMMMAARASAAAPVAVAEDAVVSATVSAVAVLRPR